MVTIPGASQFINAATLANKEGLSAVAPTVLGEGDTASLLDIGRNLGGNGIGLSPQARALNVQQIQNSAAEFNALFSLGVAETSSIEALQTQILALRAKTPAGQLSRGLAGLDDAVGSQEVDDAVAEERAEAEAAEASRSLSGSSSSVLSGGSGAFLDDSA